MHPSVPLPLLLRLRLSDRKIDVVGEGLDMAFHMGTLEDSTLKLRMVADCPRVLCAAPAYIDRRGDPADGEALVRDRHDCLNLRFPGALEFQWTLVTGEGPRKFEVNGPFETDDGEIADHLKSGALVPVARATPPLPVQLSCLTQHRRLRDPKIRTFTDFIIARCRSDLAKTGEGLPPEFGAALI